VYPGAQIERLGELLQERDHRLSVAITQSPAYLVIQGGDQSGDPGNQGRSGPGQAHVEGSPVLRAAVPSHPTSGFHVIDQAHHVVAVDPERIGQLLLGLAPGAGQVAQDSEGARRDSQGRESFGKQLRRTGTDLGQQEREGIGVGRRST
jgi:hypothetical protein